MRLAAAVVLGIALAVPAAWWMQRTPVPPADAATAPAPGKAAPGSQAPVLYRWRDDAGTLQITDRPPPDQPHTAIDSAALERRNVLDPPR